MRHLKSLITYLLLATPLVAQSNALGQITAFVDGDERVWHTISMTQGGKQVATASLKRHSNLTQVYLQGHPEPRFSSKDMFSIDVRYEGHDPLEGPPVAIDVLLLPNGMAGPIWTSQGNPMPPEFQIVDFTMWGKAGEITAVFSAELCATQITSGPVDLNNCLRLSGKVVSKIIAD